MEQYFGMWMGFLGMILGLGVAYYSIWLRSKAREMKHREHMAMIEKGIAPTALMESEAIGGGEKHNQFGTGVFMICMGLALTLMFFLTAGVGSIWIGFFVVMFGVANLITGLMGDRSRRRGLPAQTTKAPDL